jgi:hypothetical protein
MSARAKYKRTGRWEAHIWDSSEPVGRKGKQLHLGSFPSARPAALCACTFLSSALTYRPTLTCCGIWSLAFPPIAALASAD